MMQASVMAFVTNNSSSCTISYMISIGSHHEIVPLQSLVQRFLFLHKSYCLYNSIWSFVS
jgi:hypothetical protein